MGSQRATLLVMCVLVIGIVEMQGTCLGAAVTRGSSRIEKTSIVAWGLPAGRSMRI